MKKALAFAIVSLAMLFSIKAQAQFIGYTSPQSIQQTLANNQLCAGGLVFPVQNIGQTTHIVTVTSDLPLNTVSLQIRGIDPVTGIAAVISNTAYGTTTTSTFAVIGYGYFPQIEIDISCSLVGVRHFTLNYAGTSVYQANDLGDMLIARNSYILANNLSVGTTAFLTSTSGLYLPYGNMSGVLRFESGAVPAGSSLRLQCLEGTGTVVSTITYQLPVAGGIQLFYVPDFSCSKMQVLYTAGGASANLYRVSFAAKAPGTQSAVDPCQSSGIPKSSAVVTAPATATTQIVALSGLTSIYVCGFEGSQSAIGAFQWEYGTGASCGTGTTTLSGAETTLAGAHITYGLGSTVMTAPPGNALCVVTSVLGTLNGVLTYVQQ